MPARQIDIEIAGGKRERAKQEAGSVERKHNCRVDQGTEEQARPALEPGRLREGCLRHGSRIVERRQQVGHDLRGGQLGRELAADAERVALEQRRRRRTW